MRVRKGESGKSALETADANLSPHGSHSFQNLSLTDHVKASPFMRARIEPSEKTPLSLRNTARGLTFERVYDFDFDSAISWLMIDGTTALIV